MQLKPTDRVHQAKSHDFRQSVVRAALAFPLLLLTFMILLGAGEDQSKTPAAPPIDNGVQPVETPSNFEGNQWAVVRPGEFDDYNQRQTLINRGKRVYNMYCVGCHGEKGDGLGVAAEYLITQPRDFTSGIYKFRSTDSSSLPLETDLHRTITRGLSRVSMPAFPLMPEHDKVAVIQYIKAFYPNWDTEAPKRVRIHVPTAPSDLLNVDRVKRGRLVYLGAGCASCHGTDGAGKGATQLSYTDAWGNPQRPFNFTQGRLKGGDDPEDIYRTFHTGLRSIMPAFGPSAMIAINQQGVKTKLTPAEMRLLQDLLETFPTNIGEANNLSDAEKQALVERNSWDMVAYVLSLRQTQGK